MVTVSLAAPCCFGLVTDFSECCHPTHSQPATVDSSQKCSQKLVEVVEALTETHVPFALVGKVTAPALLGG